MSAKTYKVINSLTLMLVMILAGCQSKPEASPAAVDNSAVYTQAAETIVAELTRNAPTATMTIMASATLEALPPTSTPLPTNTPLPTEPALPTETPVPSELPTMTSTPEPLWIVAYKDNFSYTEGWVVGDFDSSRMRYTENGYVIKNLTVQDAVWSVRNSTFDGVRVEVDASRLSGPQDGYYGVVCHFDNGSNYYLLAVGPDGWFGIGIQEAGELTFLKEGRDSGGAVLTGNEVNHIRADCTNGKLILYVNEVKLLEVEDSTFNGGQVGLAAGTRKTSKFEALFDNFIVYVPE